MTSFDESRRKEGLRIIRSHAALRRALERLRPSAISVDFFDTLVIRACGFPGEILPLVSAQAADLGIPKSWESARRRAEAVLSGKRAPADTNLAEIYALLVKAGHLTAELAETLSQLELDVELANWIPNLPLIELLTAWRSRGATITVCSDTYLPTAVIEDWLRPHLPGVKVMCSSDTGATKRHGGMFELLRHQSPGAVVAHIGDNQFVDGRAASFGIAPFIVSYYGGHCSSLPYEGQAMSRSMGAGPIFRRFVQQTNLRSPDFTCQIAFMWAMILVDFYRQLSAYAEAQKIDQVWMLSRDCESLWTIATQTERAAVPEPTYVTLSRRSLEPLLTAPASDAAAACSAYLHGQLRSTTRRLLIVDVGWTGGIQSKLARVLPSNLEIFGFYFSMTPRAAKTLAGPIAMLFAVGPRCL